MEEALKIIIDVAEDYLMINSDMDVLDPDRQAEIENAIRILKGE